MFEDLVGKKVVNKIIEVFDIQNQCPHCKTDNIVKRTMTRFMTIAMRNKRPAYCPKCRKLWYIVNNVKEGRYNIQHLSKKSSGAKG